MILSAPIASPALRTSVKTPVKRHTTPVESRLNAELYITVLYANVRLNGLAIRMFNASNVRSNKTVMLTFSVYIGE